MDMDTYDLMIVGAGPAGMTAALYAQRMGLNVVVFGDIAGGSTYMIEQLNNFPGFMNGIPGTQFGLQTYQQKSESNAEAALTLLPSMSFFKKFSKLRLFVVIADKFNPRIYITVFIFS